MASQRPYQGYPYVNPPVIDAPSIDATTASRWTNLPRKQIHVPLKKENQQVLYINVPEDRPGTSTVVEEVETQTETRELRPSLPAKKEIDETPVVYIDLPEDSTSDVVENRTEVENNEPEFVQETIFYDPFEDRRINTNDRTKADESDTASDVSSVHSVRELPNRFIPNRPDTLNFNAPGPSGNHFSASPSNTSSIQTVSSSIPNLPPMLSKETLVYGRTPAQDFSISPIPMSSFPEPPPSYTEIDRVSTPIVEQPRRQPNATTPPPRTRVITPMGQNNNFLPQGVSSPTDAPQGDHEIPIGTMNTDRKYLNCHHCGMRVHTLVVREVGTITIAVSLLCLIICMLPIILLIYTTDCLKNRNHYCPNCNKLIGYQVPFDNKKLVYVN